jgi:hypothetical protein
MLISSTQNNIPNHLSIKHRTSICEQAVKKMATIEQPHSQGAKKQLQWVKKFCRQGSK